MPQNWDEIKVTDSDVEEREMGENLERLNQNLARVEELSKRLVAALSSRDPGTWASRGRGRTCISRHPWPIGTRR
jgi:hypothetical protein